MKKPVPLRDLTIRADGSQSNAGPQRPEQIAAVMRRWRIAQATVEAEAEIRRNRRSPRAPSP